MRPLVTNQRVLMWLCVCPPDELTKKWQKRVYIIFSVSVFLANLIGLAASLAYFYQFLSIDLEKSLCTVSQIAATISTVYAGIYLFLSRHKITKLFAKLLEIYKQSKFTFNLQLTESI